MKTLFKSQRLVVETLEDRCVPANFSFVNGNLLISNPTVSGGSTSLTLTQTAPGSFSIVDGVGAPILFDGVNGISVIGSSVGDDISIELGGFDLAGNLQLNTGAGDDTININNGGILGQVNLQTGIGDDILDLNRNSTGGLSVGGRLFAYDQAGSDTIRLGNSSAVSFFGDDVSAMGYNTVRIGNGQSDLFGNNLSFSLGRDAGAINLNQGQSGGSEITQIGGNFSIGGGNLGDSVTLRGMLVGGNLTVNLGNAIDDANEFTVSSSALSQTSVAGNVTYTGGSGVDDLDLGSGIFTGNVLLNLGVGGDQVAMNTFSVPTFVGGNLSIYSSGGLNFTGNGVEIHGNSTILVGFGSNSISFNAASSVDGNFYLRASIGVDLLNLPGYIGGNIWLINV